MSAPQSAPAPQAPHITVPPAQAPAAEASSSRAPSANAAAHDTINTAPATGPTYTIPPATANSTAGTQHPTTEEPLSYNDKLNAGDRYWKFKFALKAILIITGFIGIGCVGWSISTGQSIGYDFGYSFWSLWPTLITFSISIVWCAVCILIFVIRKRPVTPGARVAMDLLLWLGFIVSALFATAALIDMLSWGDYSNFGYGSSYYGDYEMANNGTWVWVQDTSYISSPRSCNGSSSSYYYESSFKDCAEQDALVNKLWQEKGHRANVELTAVVCQYFGIVLHIALFIWACVDTHRYNRSKVSKDAEKIAANIVQTMINNGAVVPPPGQAYMRPQMGQGMYYQLPPQQAYPLATMPPQRVPGQYQQSAAPGQYRAGSPSAPGPALGPSNEKSQGPRYA
ncbi:Nn.00g000500.m01.CDS01 [Neocucurbitaria sp. VM-36]